MGAQRLNDKKRRQIEASTGLSIWRAWSNHNWWRIFVTNDHRHGYWHRGTGEWEFDDNPTHFTTCAERFPEETK